MTTAQRRLSGWCNPYNPRTALYDPHSNCQWPGCTCHCHQEDPMPDPTPTITTPRSDGVTTSTAPPEDVVFSLSSMADQLNASLRGYSPDDWRDAARLLHRLRVVTSTLKALDSSLVNWLYLHGEHGLHQVIDGVPGEVSITRGRSKERWDAEGAVKAYVEAQLRETGEVPDPLQVMAWVLEVVPATQSTSLRKTPLKEAKIDLADYYWSEPGTLQVSTPT